MADLVRRGKVVLMCGTTYMLFIFAKVKGGSQGSGQICHNNMVRAEYNLGLGGDRARW